MYLLISTAHHQRAIMIRCTCIGNLEDMYVAHHFTVSIEGCSLINQGKQTSIFAQAAL